MTFVNEMKWIESGLFTIVNINLKILLNETCIKINWIQSLLTIVTINLLIFMNETRIKMRWIQSFLTNVSNSLMISKKKLVLK
jgi:hypothetical protein